MSVDPQAVQQYLHTHIPLSADMEVVVADAGDQGVRLRAPLGPNINHRSTIFGGSASTLAILSAWTLLHTRLRDLPFRSEIVIQRNTVEYERPMHDDFEAFAPAPGAADWSRFLQALERRGRGRLTLDAELWCAGERAGTFRGVYVALRQPESGRV